MKLSELVSYLNLLESNELATDYYVAVKKFHEIGHVVANHAVQIDEYSSAFAEKINAITREFQHAQTALDDLKSHVRKQIAALEPAQYQASQRVYEEEMCYEPTEYILNRRLVIDTDSRLLLTGRLLQYTDWRLPGLIVRPGREKFIEELVPLDPLYLVDQHEELMQPAIQAFTPEYQRRLRPYVIDDYKHVDALRQLPANQFGLIFAYNYFNYKPMKVVREYLDSMFARLRPGGVAIFTYNDCDWAHGVALAEKNFMCYTPGREIQAHCNQLGFETLSVNHGQGDVAWMEIKKPGEIESIRGGQSLAKIVANQ
jgi:SAM-dependent methyltransferase